MKVGLTQGWDGRVVAGPLLTDLGCGWKNFI